ncbi:hypothetical protein BJ912DRAFT_1001516 [Pholiota molesta]|nr:hypothetical protein BJ912DRAFT_1001516 [Pholiota molesta]
MSVPVKDVLLVGFGAVGAIYSLILKRSGLARVTVVARSNYGLVNESKYGDIKGWRPDRRIASSLTPDKVCRSVADAADRPYSYVVVTTKAVPEVVKTSKILGPLLANEYTAKFAQPTYVLVQNGLNVEVDLTALWIGTNLVAPNVDRLTIGYIVRRLYHHSEYTCRGQPSGGLGRSGNRGSTVNIVPEIQRHKFSKNFWNVAFSSFTTLTQYTVPAIYRAPPADPSISYTPFVRRALGFPDSPDGLPSSVIDGAIDGTRKFTQGRTAHMSQHAARRAEGLPIEVEVILGEVVRMAKAHNVPLPVGLRGCFCCPASLISPPAY